MMHTVYQYYRTILLPYQQHQYDFIVKAWENRNLKVAFSSPLIDDGEEINNIVRSVAFDHPELFWVNYYHYSIERIGIGKLVKRYMIFEPMLPWTEITEIQKRLYKWRDQIYQKACLSNPQKNRVRAIADYLARSNTYGNPSNILSHTIIGCMDAYGNKAVCEGLSKCMKFLCDSLSVNSLIVMGKAASPGQPLDLHSWNIIDIGDRYQHVDLTRILEIGKKRGYVPLEYIFCSDKELEDDGYIWNQRILPHCI